MAGETEEERLDYMAVLKMSADLRKAAAALGEAEARFLVDMYYAVQEMRKRTANQVSVLEEGGEPNEMIRWTFKNWTRLENDVKSGLSVYSRGRVVRDEAGLEIV